MNQLTPAIGDGFKSYLLSPKAGLKGETPQNYLSRFRRILKHAEDQNLIVKDPSRGLSIRRTNELHKEVLSATDIQILASTPCGNQQVRRAFLFSCFTGTGLAEVREITKANVRNERFIYERKKPGKP